MQMCLELKSKIKRQFVTPLLLVFSISRTCNCLMSRSTVHENIIGAPKIQNNFWLTVKILISPILQST